MATEIKTFLGSIADASDKANEYLGHNMFNDQFRTELRLTGLEDGLSHLCISLARVSEQEVALDYLLISPVVHSLQVNGMTDKVIKATEKAVRKKLKQLKVKFK